MVQDIAGCDAYYKRCMLLFDDFQQTRDVQAALKDEVPPEADFILAFSAIPHTGRGKPRKFSQADIPGEMACR